RAHPRALHVRSGPLALGIQVFQDQWWQDQALPWPVREQSRHLRDVAGRDPGQEPRHRPVPTQSAGEPVRVLPDPVPGRVPERRERNPGGSGSESARQHRVHARHAVQGDGVLAATGHRARGAAERDHDHLPRGRQHAVHRHGLQPLGLQARPVQGARGLRAEAAVGDPALVPELRVARVGGARAGPSPDVDRSGEPEDGTLAAGAAPDGSGEYRAARLIRSMEGKTPPAPSRAAERWILALAVLLGAGIPDAASAQVGIQPSLSGDATGAARVAFFDLFHGDLEFATRSSITGAWTVQIVDSRGGKGIHPSLADSARADGSPGEPAVAYYDQDNGDLVFAKRSGGVWRSLTVDATGDVGSFCSLKYSPLGPAIAYFDATNGDLKLASWNGADWTIEPVDATGNVGQHCSLTFDPVSQFPAIAYYDATNRALKL